VSRYGRGIPFARRRKLGAFGALSWFHADPRLIAPLVQRFGDQQVFETQNPEFNLTANPLDIARTQTSAPPPFWIATSRPAERWPGTDQYGRDIYARIIVGARLAVIIGIGASIVAVVAGTVVGLVSGYFGGLVDLTVQRFVDGPRRSLSGAAAADRPGGA
jgi:ABC-type dipeptide/oligopeptide/nickel transport system permease subunit